MRWRVFAEELGATLATAEPGLDRDRWDPWCDHLVVQERATARVIATYRMLPAARAVPAGGLYAESVFALGPLQDIGRLVEVGRACVDREHRTGVVLALLWGGLLRWLDAGGHAHVIGCASVSLASGVAGVAGLCRRLLDEHGAPPSRRVVPRVPFPLDAHPAVPAPAVPPLLKGYLRLGAEVCGPPAWDRDFGTADLLVHLPLSRLSRRHADHLLRAA